MVHSLAPRISAHLSISEVQVQKTLNLISEGATIPFIARYRKEQTGSLDETQIAAIKDADENLQKLLKRKESILKSIEEQGKLDLELKARISDCWDLAELEDLYLPY
ncbi:MAG: Tex-like N-terminal domain-containing protein, partial [Croceimicrobium sp.]